MVICGVRTRPNRSANIPAAHPPKADVSSVTVPISPASTAERRLLPPGAQNLLTWSNFRLVLHAGRKPQLARRAAVSGFACRRAAVVAACSNVGPSRRVFELDEKARVLREWRSVSFQLSVCCRRDHKPKFGAKRRCGGGPKFSTMSFDDTSAN